MRLTIQVQLGPDYLADVKKAALIRALHECGEDIEETAAVLGVSLSTLYRWMKDLDIPRPHSGA